MVDMVHVPPQVQDQDRPVIQGFASAEEKPKKFGFLAHLFGTDDPKNGPKVTGTNSPLQGIKFKDIFQGVVITPNFLLLLMFLGFFLWLFVVYWVRHNEPLVNHVLGGASHSPTAKADKAIVAGVKKAFPVRVSANTGEVYVPGGPHGPELAPKGMPFPAATPSQALHEQAAHPAAGQHRSHRLASGQQFHGETLGHLGQQRLYSARSSHNTQAPAPAGTKHFLSVNTVVVSPETGLLTIIPSTPLTGSGSPPGSHSSQSTGQTKNNGPVVSTPHRVKTIVNR